MECVRADENREEGIEGGKERKGLNSILSPPHTSPLLCVISPPPHFPSPSLSLIVRVLGPSLTFNKSL